MHNETHKPLILIVDDMPANIQVLAETLRGDYRIKVATSGRAALDIVAKDGGKPDLILLDVTMSGMDGYEVCRRLKDDAATREIPVIFVTSRSNALDEERGLRLGAMDYIAKPFHPAIVRARVRNHIRLKHTADELRLADQRKDEFLAMLAHELRNPLVPIRNAAHILGRLLQQEPAIKWAQETIETQVAHLARLVEDLLDVSRIARGKTPIKKELVEFATLVRQVLEAARPLAESKRHDLTVRLPDEAVYLDVDPVRLSQVLHNLLDNAVKYTPDGGKIEFDARLSGPELEITVRDNGAGIAPELLPHVFEMFQQGERTLDRAQGGLGIGLTLVQRLVVLHGGRVEARSDGPNHGSTFTVWLPTVPAPTMPVADEMPAKSVPCPMLRVLVVDDDEAVADSTAVLLDMAGYDVRVAADGLAALELMPQFQPQAVLLDIGLEGMDGFEVARRLRQLPEGRGLCLIAVTGYGDEKTRAAVSEAGFDHHMIKPTRADSLVGLLAKVAACGHPGGR